MWFRGWARPGSWYIWRGKCSSEEKPDEWGYHLTQRNYVNETGLLSEIDAMTLRSVKDTETLMREMQRYNVVRRIDEKEV